MNYMEADWLYEDVRHAKSIRSHIPEEELETNKDLKRVYEIEKIAECFFDNCEKDHDYISDDDYDELARELVTIKKKYVPLYKKLEPTIERLRKEQLEKQNNG